jgi:hypothetical protein
MKPYYGLFILLAAACSELDEPYPADPGHRLSFSVDTLSFDTVFTTIGSATRHFMVYNDRREAINIEDIRLENGANTFFRINVDGRSGRSFSNIHLPGNDSLYVFVEVTVAPAGANQPVLQEDRLAFTVNGAKQTLPLRAYGQDVHLYRGGFAVSRDTLWTADRPYLIYDSLTVDSGVTLTIEKGAALYMHNKARWVIKGTIKAVGTLDEPVVFRGDRLDNLLVNIPYDRIANQWDGLYFDAGSYGNEMIHVIVRNGNSGLCFAESDPGQPKLKITDSQITNMEQSVLSAVNCHIEAINTEFSNATGNVVSLSGGNYHFIHCTLANYYLIRPGRSGLPVLSLRNCAGSSGTPADKKGIPLYAVFDNCLVDGSFSEGKEPLKGELSIDKSGEEALYFRFNHCALKTMQAEDTCFVNTRFIHRDNAPVYKSAGNADNGFLFNFRPDTAKVLIGRADYAIALQYPLDRFGIDRATSPDGPDIGAYEYVPEAEQPPHANPQ